MSNGFTTRLVDKSEIPQFRLMVEAYWQEMMPKAASLQTPEARDAYFAREFTWAGGNDHPYWAIADDTYVGFIAFEVELTSKFACINNFYIVPEARRKGNGSALMQWIFTHLDSLGIEQIDLNVRRDNPHALAFWQSQGFGIAKYHLRQYRDPVTHTAFKGVLSSDF